MSAVALVCVVALALLNAWQVRRYARLLDEHAERARTLAEARTEIATLIPRVHALEEHSARLADVLAARDRELEALYNEIGEDGDPHRVRARLRRLLSPVPAPGGNAASGQNVRARRASEPGTRDR